MNYRQAVILDNETATTAATKTIDLKGLDPMSQLIVQMSGVNNGATPTAHPAKMVSSIQIVDGSNVLWSLSGIEAQALAQHQTENMPLQVLSYLNDNYCRAIFPLNFGRWLWDEELAFDPSRFKNPQLKITHNKASGGSAPDAGYLSVVGMMFDDLKVNPLGYLMAKEHYSYTLVASAKEPIPLPTDYILKSLTIQSLAAGYAPNSNFNHVKLHENNNKKVVLDDSTSNLLKYLMANLPPVSEHIRARLATTDVTFYITPTYECAVVGSPADASAGYVEVTYPYGGSVAVQAATACDADLFVRGWAPHGAMNIPFGDAWDANRWYDITKLAKLDLEITAGSGASGTCQIVTEQLKRY